MMSDFKGVSLGVVVLEHDENDTNHQNAWDAAKGKKNICIKIQEERKMSEIDYFSFDVEKLEREEQDKTEVSRRKEITKTRAEASDVVNSEAMNKASAIVSRCFEKTNQIDQTPARPIGVQREDTKKVPTPEMTEEHHSRSYRCQKNKGTL